MIKSYEEEAREEVMEAIEAQRDGILNPGIISAKIGIANIMIDTLTWMDVETFEHDLELNDSFPMMVTVNGEYAHGREVNADKEAT